MDIVVTDCNDCPFKSAEWSLTTCRHPAVIKRSPRERELFSLRSGEVPQWCPLWSDDLRIEFRHPPSSEELAYLAEKKLGLYIRPMEGEPDSAFRSRLAAAMRDMAVRNGADANPASVIGTIHALMSDHAD